MEMCRWDSIVTGAPKYRRAAEFSAPPGEIPQVPLPGGSEPLKTLVFSEIPTPFWLAQLLPL